MYLKRLEIKGFKSFADKTVLDFLPYKNNRHSITAIVGPNGSGKSNISDAVRWVMGEQSLKTLRGKKNEDIIFGGSTSKGQLSAAEVTMILDNSPDSAKATTGKGWFMEDYPEITVARRLYRSGEGEYLINNNPARMIDVHLLLAQAQFAQHSYSVVGQGMIDRLLVVSPAERKDFLDEASGIKEFQIKQHQAELKLARTVENVTQAERLVQEVEPRLKILARQVKKLEQRQEVELKLRENQEQYYASIYLVNKSELDKLNSILVEVEKDYRLAFKELEEVQKELSVLARDSAEEENKASDSAGQIIAEQRKLLEQISKDKTNVQLKIFSLEKQIYQDQSEQNYRHVSGLSAAQAVLENKDKFGVVHGLVAELGEVEEKYKVALEVAAGSYLSALVVASDEVAKSAIEFLRHNRLGFATFLPLNKINPRPAEQGIDKILAMPGVLGLAADIVKHEDKFNDIFSFVFGQTVVVESLSVAQKVGIGRARMVTLAGDLVEKTGVMKGGYKQIKKDGLGFSSRLAWSKDRLAEYQSQINLEKEKIIKLEASYEEAKEKLLELESKREATNSKTKLLKAFSLQETMQKKQNLVNEILAKRNDLKIQAAKLETKQDSVSEEVRAELNSTVEAVIERKPPVVSLDKVGELMSEVQKLKYQLSLIGGIDEEVVAEHQQTKERFDFLVEQIADLRAAMADLGKMILELDDIMKKKRAASFKKIRKEFDRYVKILFGGGTGDIHEIYGPEPDAEASIQGGDEEMLSPSYQEGAVGVAEEKDVRKNEKILTGIDISINPPGKKIKNINTLSGGERTLTSIALICAILSYNPAPFVVLDEVEAALDEPNTCRFAEIITELSSQSQFIIITHNRVTMHAADALYGVVMGQDGVSKLLSVKLEEAAKYDASTVSRPNDNVIGRAK